MTGTSAIRMDRLTKHYPGVQALTDLTLDVPAGSIYGFLGPNGAGKTTTLKILGGLIRPTGGTAIVSGVPMTAGPAYRRQVGYLAQDPRFYDWMTGRETLEFVASVAHDPTATDRAWIGAQGIVFASLEEAHRTIDTIRKIHGSVEMARGMAIPDWAYRDVLFMLIHYSIAAHELFDRKLSEAEKAEVYDVFYRVGKRMGLKELPASYPDWLPAREAHLHQDLQYSHFTADLHKQYKKHLGPLRFRILKEGQKVVVPAHVQKLLRLHGLPLLRPLLPAWRLARKLHIAPLLLSRLLPKPYRPQLKLLIVSN